MSSHNLMVVPIELLNAEAAHVATAPARSLPAPDPEPTDAGRFSSKLLIEKWLADRGREFRKKPEPDSQGRRIYALKACPFDATHGDPDACIMQEDNGKMSAHCFHNSCQEKGWQDFKEAIGKPDAEHFDPPLSGNTGGAKQPTPTLVETTAIMLPSGERLSIEMRARPGTRQPLVLAKAPNVEHRDRLDPDRAASRRRFIADLAAKLGIAPDELGPLLESPLTTLGSQISVANDGSGAYEERESQVSRAIKLTADWELWHSASGEAYATFSVDNRRETWQVRSTAFGLYLGKIFYEEYDEAINSESRATTLNLLEAKGRFNGPEHPVFVRVGEHEGKIYLDLCNSAWQVVEITSAGWQIINESPIHFRRSQNMLPLPAPERGGHVDLLRHFLNVEDYVWILIVAWLVATFRPKGPYPILALFAEQGSGKSTAGRFLRSLVDPNVSPLRAEASDCRDLMISAKNSWCLAYDNLSHLTQPLSDALCRLSTGGGFGTRALYTDQDEITFDSQRPVLLTSIEDIATRSDLLDRSLVVRLQTIDEAHRRPEAELVANFQNVQPLIIGALLDAVSVALRRLPTQHLGILPRMADFAVWAAAAETSFGWAEGTFIAAYKKSNEVTNELALESEIIGPPLLEILEKRGSWSGTSTDLLSLLETRVTEQAKRQKGWPRNARALSGRLARIKPNLQKQGWIVQQSRSSGTRSWHFQRVNDAPAGPSRPRMPSDASSNEPCKTLPGDADQCKLVAGDASDGDDAKSPPAPSPA